MAWTMARESVARVAQWARLEALALEPAVVAAVGLVRAPGQVDQVARAAWEQVSGQVAVREAVMAAERAQPSAA